MKRFIFVFLTALSCMVSHATTPSRYDYPDIINLTFNPDNGRHHTGCFADMGSWMGFSVCDSMQNAVGFRGPFSILGRYWMAKSIVAMAADDAIAKSNYYPGELTLRCGAAKEHLVFADSHSALLRIEAGRRHDISLSAIEVNADVRVSVTGHDVFFHHKSGECAVVSLPKNMEVRQNGNNYIARKHAADGAINIAISFYWDDSEAKEIVSNARRIMLKSDKVMQGNTQRWNGYLAKVLRTDVPKTYSRVAVKSVVTLISNWRTRRGGLLHDGIVPSHAVDYFVGCWAWDCWRFSAAMATFFPALAKDNIRVMFDYQQPDGMIIDCVFPDTKDNNSRDSKPPLACWAVDRIYENTHDVDFIREMYPKLLRYYKWWYRDRDHDGNGICEFGCVDGTTEAAAWESGMDNAVRFDSAVMVRNGAKAWSLNQESVDLNVYLAVEYTLLKKFAKLIGEPFDMPDHRGEINDYFFDKHIGFFCDRRLETGEYIEEPGCEGYLPFWAGTASKSQFSKARVLLEDSKKFSTFIPFPTIAADNPKYDANGYWRGPIWLDQTYYAINGFRKYGEAKRADQYTDEVFMRLQGLIGDAPIFENYDTFTGHTLQSSHFSWSAAHLLLLYEEYGKQDINDEF
jgi:putative isomerase